MRRVEVDGLPLLFQVTEVCGAKHLGYFGPSQFYVALKLLAAAQSGLPVQPESVTASKSAASERRRLMLAKGDQEITVTWQDLV